MTAFVTGIRKVGGNIIDTSYRCFVCGDKDAGFDLPCMVASKQDGERLNQLFNSIVDHCSLLDYRPSEPSHIQVKLSACPKHKNRLDTLARIIWREYRGRKIPVTPEMINSARH